MLSHPLLSPQNFHSPFLLHMALQLELGLRGKRLLQRQEQDSRTLICDYGLVSPLILVSLLCFGSSSACGPATHRQKRTEVLKSQHWEPGSGPVVPQETPTAISIPWELFEGDL